MKQNRKFTFVLLSIAIVESIFLLVYLGPVNHYDTNSYILAWNNSWSQGEIDVFRTPIYPIFLGILKSCFGEKTYLWAATIIQHIIFIASVYCFSLLTRRCIKRGTLSFCITFIFLLLPLITKVNNYILTESLSVSGIIFLLSSLQLMQKTGKTYSIFIHTCLLLSLIFLRPSFIYLLPILFLYWIIIGFKKENIKKSLWGITSVLVVTSCILIYMFEFEKKYYIFSTSNVGTFNQLWIAREYGLLNPEVIENEKFRKDVYDSYQMMGKKILRQGDNQDQETIALSTTYKWIEKYDLKTLNDAITKSYKSNPLAYINCCFQRIHRWRGEPILHRGSKLSDLLATIGFNMSIVYLFCIIYAIYIFMIIATIKKISKWDFLLYQLLIFSLIIIVLGSPNAYPRLFLPSIPILLLMFGRFCSFLHVKFLK